VATSLIALLDDITSILDDVSVLTKVAASKTAGVVGDDLAVNAEQVAGVSADRELPVVWAVAKGSLVNKAILVPAALAISAFAPWGVRALLMLGGAYLCYEGFEKLAHWLMHRRAEDDAHHRELQRLRADPAADLLTLEKSKIRGAIRTDFVLSAEIIVITLGSVADKSLPVQILVLSLIALAMTVGVYGLVAGIVKLDDFGFFLSRRSSAFAQWMGRAILRAAPWLMRALAVAGTTAMFLVGGSILVHGLPRLQDALAGVAVLASLAAHGAVGILVGAVVLGAVTLGRRWLPQRPAQ
jgi:predicted DNA repair protein MutK